MNLRNKNLVQLKYSDVDVFIVGGGINGAVSFSALSASGVNVALVDQEDFAANCSSHSSNLVWGGIKYLETHEYGLVSKLCKSRNNLMQSFPSSVKEIRFLTTIRKGFRFPPFFVFLGTIVYWALGRFKTLAPQYLSSKRIRAIEPAIRVDDARGGFEYSDCYLVDNDSRFVFNFIRAGMNRGANAANYTKVVSTQRVGDRWHIQLKDTVKGELFSVTSKMLVNACGAQVDYFNASNNIQTEHRHLYSKGVHLIVDKAVESDKVLAFFASDGRLFFVLPMGTKTCIGTTDTQVAEPTKLVTNEDRHFILDNANEMLNLDEPLTLQSVIAERCGVRPLAQRGDGSIADWVKLSRKHAIDVDLSRQQISIFGGKLTDCINVGEEIVGIASKLGLAAKLVDEAWYGEAGESEKEKFLQRAQVLKIERTATAFDGELLTERLWRRYGQAANHILALIERDPDLLSNAVENTDFILAEILHARDHEMVVNLSDFLRRRSMIELTVRQSTLRGSDGLRQVCKILFGDEASAEYQRYFMTLDNV